MLDAEKVISEIAWRWVSSKQARNQFIAENVDYEQFPFNEAIELISDFERDFKKHGSRHAFDIFKPRAARFCSPELQIETPSTLIVEQARIVEKYQIERTASLMLNDPARGREYINEFQQRKGTQLKSYSFRELIELTTEHFEKKLFENKMLVEVLHWPILSKIIDGFEPGRFAIFTGESGIGKTLWSLQFALDASETMSVVYLNQEMTNYDIGARLIGESTGLTKAQLRRGEWSAQAVENLGVRINKAKNLSFTDGRSLSLEQIVSLARHKKANGGLDLLIIDYDQKIKLSLKRGEQEWQAMLAASETLEELAKELDTFILLLAQADKDGLQKASKRAVQPASVQIHFFKTENEEYILELKKNRFGRNGVKIKLDCRPEINRITEVDIWTPPEEPEKKRMGTRQKPKPLYFD